MRERKSCAIDFSNDPGLTEQSHRDACNVNNIIKKHLKTGAITHLNKMEAQYGDVSGIDFQSALETVERAQEAFDLLPSQVRKKFHNNPALFLDFTNDPENARELVEMGLATRTEIEKMVNEGGKVNEVNNRTDTNVATENTGEGT